MKRFSMMALFAVIAAVAGGGYWYWQKGEKETADKGKAAVAQGPGAKAGKESKGKGKGAGGPVIVRMASASRQAMPVVIDAVGSIEPEQSVAIRPQIIGTLTTLGPGGGRCSISLRPACSSGATPSAGSSFGSVPSSGSIFP